MTRRDATRRDATRRDATRRDATRRDATRRDATRRDATRRDATRRDATRRDATRHDTTRHDTTRHDTTRHDTTRHDTTRHDTTRHDTTFVFQLNYCLRLDGKVNSYITACVIEFWFRSDNHSVSSEPMQQKKRTTGEDLPASKISSPVVGSRGVRLRRTKLGLALRLSGFSGSMRLVVTTFVQNFRQRQDVGL